MLESPRRNRNLLDRRFDMSLNLVLVTLNACATPFRNVCIHFGPKVSTSYRFSRRTSSRVRQIVYLVKNFSSHSCRNVNSIVCVLNFTPNERICTRNVNSLQFKRRLWLILGNQWLKFIISLLYFNKLRQIWLVERNFLRICSRKCVSDNILVTFHISNIWRNLGNENQMSLLSRSSLCFRL